MTTGLIVGRFLPPHAGHQLLVDTASALADAIVLLLVVSDDDSIPADLREQWLHAMFPAVRIARCAAPTLTDGGGVAAIKRCVPGKVDLVFAGDGDEVAFASSLGARYVQIDPHNQSVPVRSRDVRADPQAYWPFLPEPVRPHYAKTICLHGPESTGKSTLAPTLAAHFETLWLPEYGRTYCETFGLALTMADLLAIGRTHQAMTEAAKKLCNRTLILDTDPLMTAAWAEMLFDASDPWFGGFQDVADLYLLLDIDMPWIDDGTRFFGGDRERRRFFDCARDQLERRGIAYALIGGPPEERFDRALDAIRTAGLD